jgi:hypothetical protein
MVGLIITPTMNPTIPMEITRITCVFLDIVSQYSIICANPIKSLIPKLNKNND